MGSTDTKTFTVTIIGGGIGGLTLAAGLLRRNVRVQIYEAASAFAEIGLGLSIGPAAHRAMPLIDPQIREIYDSLVTTHADSPGYESFKDTWFEVIWASGEKEGDLLMDLKALPSGQTTLRRADFLDALVGLVPREIVHFGKRLESLVEGGDEVQLKFDDGTTVGADVVIGCDGIRSKVKESMLPEESKPTQPRYSGMYGYRAVLDMKDMVDAVGDQRARVSTMYIGEGAYGISYPIMRAQKVNVGVYILSEKWDCDTWVRKANREDMVRDTENMGRYVKSLVEVGEASSHLACISDVFSAHAGPFAVGDFRTSPYLYFCSVACRHPRRRSSCFYAASRCRCRAGYRRCACSFRASWRQSRQVCRRCRGSF